MSKHPKIFIIVGLLLLLTSLTAIIGIMRYRRNSFFNLAKLDKIENLVPVVIIGSGPAGLSAALFTARAHMKTVVLTGAEPGGQLTQVQQIENWPAKEKMSGNQLMDELMEQAKKFGAHIVYALAKQVDFSQWPFKITSDDGKIINALTVIIATGGQPKKPQIPGVDQYWGKGAGLCTICDAPFNKNQEVIVVGKNDYAAERALQLAAYAKKVTMIYCEDTLSACATVQEYLAEHPTITLVPHTEVISINGDEKNVTGITVRDTKTQKERTIPARSIYFSIGYKPETDLFKNYIKIDKEGYIITKPGTQMTSQEGVFAGGTVEDKRYRKASVAAGNGVKAALDALTFLESIGFYAQKGEEQTTYQLYTPEKAPKSSVATLAQAQKLEQFIKTVPNKIVLLAFTSVSCPVCHHLKPALYSIEQALADKIAVLEIDVEKNPDLARQYNISMLPTVAFIKQGALQGTCSQISTRQELEACLAPLLEPDKSKTANNNK